MEDEGLNAQAYNHEDGAQLESPDKAQPKQPDVPSVSA